MKIIKKIDNEIDILSSSELKRFCKLFVRFALALAFISILNIII